MCGIAGGIGLGEDAVRRMLAVQAHRGPDDCGLISVGLATVGTCRLAIIDLAGGKQPMSSEDGKLAIVHNGEIYNFKELRRELEPLGHAFHTRSDTEVILRAYQQWGVECVHRLRGMFAFAVYDARDDAERALSSPKLIIFRDPLGIKPLYYDRGDAGFVFASEIRALLAGGTLDRRLDSTAVWEYLGWQSVPAPRTLIDGVRLLQPGHYLEVTAGGRVTETRYWDLLDDAAAEAVDCDELQARQHVRDLLHESARLHLVSDVPVGVFLSGGIDSSAALALIREVSDATPQTFTVGFSEDRFDEREYARTVAHRFGSEHTEIVLTEDDLLGQLPDALAAMDHPSGDGLNTYIVARAVGRAGLKVAISGLGGDEVFGGYPSFARLTGVRWALPAWRTLPPPVRRLAGHVTDVTGGKTIRARKLSRLLAGEGDIVSAYLLNREVFDPAERSELLNRRMAAELKGRTDSYRSLLNDSLAHKQSIGWFGWISYAEARTYMHDVLLRDTDQMGMASSVEVRVPLLDHRLAAFVVGLPDSMKRPKGTPKRLLVDSLGDLLPKEIVQRPKRGFTLPMERWMRGALRPFCEERLKVRRLAERGVLEPTAVASLWARFLAGERSTSWSRLWTLVALEEWLERNGVKT